MWGYKNTQDIPGEDVESEVKNLIMKTEQDILDYRIIQAYYNLQKASKLISRLSDSSKIKNIFKEKHKSLNNKLNSEILKFIDQHGK